LKPQAIMGGIGQRKQVLDDPVDELPVREPRITKLTPANTVITARVCNGGKVLAPLVERGPAAERL